MTLLLDPGPRPVCSQVRGEWRSFIQRGSEDTYLRPTGLYVDDVWTYAIESRVEGPTRGNQVLGIAIRQEVWRFGRPENEAPLELPRCLASNESCRPMGDRRSPQGYGGGRITGDVAEVAIQRAYDLDEARSETRDKTQVRIITKGPRKRSEKVLKTGGLRRGGERRHGGRRTRASERRALISVPSHVRPAVTAAPLIERRASFPSHSHLHNSEAPFIWLISLCTPGFQVR